MKNTLKSLIFVMLGITFMSLQSCSKDSPAKISSQEDIKWRVENAPASLSDEEISKLERQAEEGPVYQVVDIKGVPFNEDMNRFEYTITIKDKDGNIFVAYYVTVDNLYVPVNVSQKGAYYFLFDKDAKGDKRIIASYRKR